MDYLLLCCGTGFLENKQSFKDFKRNSIIYLVFLEILVSTIIIIHFVALIVVSAVPFDPVAYKVGGILYCVFVLSIVSIFGVAQTVWWILAFLKYKSFNSFREYVRWYAKPLKNLRHNLYSIPSTILWVVWGFLIVIFSVILFILGLSCFLRNGNVLASLIVGSIFLFCIAIAVMITPMMIGRRVRMNIGEGKLSVGVGYTIFPFPTKQILTTSTDAVYFVRRVRSHKCLKKRFDVLVMFKDEEKQSVKIPLLLPRPVANVFVKNLNTRLGIDFDETLLKIRKEKKLGLTKKLQRAFKSESETDILELPVDDLKIKKIENNNAIVPGGSDTIVKIEQETNESENEEGESEKKEKKVTDEEGNSESGSETEGESENEGKKVTDEDGNSESGSENEEKGEGEED